VRLDRGYDVNARYPGTNGPHPAGPGESPYRIQLLEEVPLLCEGLAEMLQPYAELVQVLPAAAPHGDLVLHDPFTARDASEIRRLHHSLRANPPWAVWTWELHRWVDAQRYVAPPVAYLSKGSTAQALVGDLLRIRAGEFVVDDDIARPKEEWPGQNHGLTRRESDVLVFVSRGMTNRQIADHLTLSINTVKTYIRGAYDAIGVTTRPQAVLWTVSHGLRPAAHGLDLGDRRDRRRLTRVGHRRW
jgi:DNA-binding NarL/FixJ family response regulator